MRSQVGFYGSSDNTGSHTEVGLRFINANSKSKSEDLGPIGECCLSLIGTIGTQDGRNSAFVHFRLLEPNTIRLVRLSPSDWPAEDEESWLMLQTARKIEYPQWLLSYHESGNYHTAKHIHCGLSDRRGKQIGLDDQGFALGHSEPRDILPKGEYYATITTQHANAAIPFHVQLLVGNPLVQMETVQITKTETNSTPAPTPTPTPTPSGTPDVEPDRTPLFSRVLPESVPDPHRSYILNAMTIIEQYVEPNSEMTGLAQLTRWSESDEYESIVALAGPLSIELLENANGSAIGANTDTFQLILNPTYSDRYDEEQWVAIWCHELFHALGIIYWKIPRVCNHMGHSSDSWQRGYLTVSEFSNAVNGYRVFAGKDDSPIAPLSDLNSAHWNRDDQTFASYPGETFPGTDALMTPSIGSGLVITDITLGALEDYGYTVTNVGADGAAPRQLRLPENFHCGADALDPAKVICRRRRARTLTEPS